MANDGDDIVAKLERLALMAEIANYHIQDMRVMPAAGVTRMSWMWELAISAITPAAPTSPRCRHRHSPLFKGSCTILVAICASILISFARMTFQ